MSASRTLWELCAAASVGGVRFSVPRPCSQGAFSAASAVAKAMGLGNAGMEGLLRTL